MNKLPIDLLGSTCFLSQALRSVIHSVDVGKAGMSFTGFTSMYLLRALAQSPLTTMVRGLSSEKMSFSQVESSLVQGLIDASSRSTPKYFIQSLLRFGSQCEKALRNENEGPVEKIITVTQIPDSVDGSALVLILVYEPIGLNLWTYRHQTEKLTLISHAADFESIAQELNGSGLESMCFDVQLDFKKFNKKRGKASWDELLDFAYELELDETRPAVQLLENNSLYDSTFSSLLNESKSAYLSRIANRTATEEEFEIDAVGWFDRVLKDDLTESLDPQSSEELRQFLANQA